MVALWLAPLPRKHGITGSNMSNILMVVAIHCSVPWTFTTRSSTDCSRRHQQQHFALTRPTGICRAPFQAGTRTRGATMATTTMTTTTRWTSRARRTSASAAEQTPPPTAVRTRPSVSQIVLYRAVYSLVLQNTLAYRFNRDCSSENTPAFCCKRVKTESLRKYFFSKTLYLSIANAKKFSIFSAKRNQLVQQNQKSYKLIM